jgi:uncharacterized membrane protein
MNSAPERVLPESSRVEAFSDGVLAIAITLLVLDIHTTSTSGHMGQGLLDQWPTYLAYVASFIYIGVVWVNHHALFTRIARVDGLLLWCNLGLLLPVSVLPFPTAELATAMNGGTHGDKIAALILYAIITMAMAVSWLLVYTHLAGHPELLQTGTTPDFFKAERLRAAAGLIAPVVPVVVGLASPSLALVLLVIMPVFYTVTADGLPTSRRHLTLR